MLHIINGASTLDTLKQSNIPGEMFSFRDALICGPTPARIDATQWRSIRARHLSEYYGVDSDHCERDLADQDQALSGFSAHEEVVLWFEHDLFCQVNLLYLLDWFAKVSRGNTRLSLINIGAFPGKETFHGLGELSAEELGAVFPERHQLTSKELDLGTSAWQAYCSVAPTAIESLLETDTSALPFLKTALKAHLQRFPSVHNGLGHIENKSLELIDRGVQRFTDLFPKFGDTERVYGLGDAQFWIALKQLASVRDPALSVKGNGIEGPLDSKAMAKTDFELTETGREVLRGQVDFVRLNDIDCWLGGVHVSGRENLWRWDVQVGRLVRK